jgi:UDP:flavonoid glycosyltransferase YjiC (YdhE family)
VERKLPVTRQSPVDHAAAAIGVVPAAASTGSAAGAAGAGSRIRVLFMGEAVTLAHVARPLALMQRLDPARCEVFLGVDGRYDALLPPQFAQHLTIRTIPSQQFLTALVRGGPVYDTRTLCDYVREDLEVIRRVQPHVVVGDFRLSLAVSTRLAHVPYCNITNAHWSPYARPRYSLPEHPLTRYLGLGVTQALFGLVRPLVFALHSVPLNRTLRRHGLPRMGFDLRRVYVEADQVLYADVPELVPTFAPPPHHHYLGPLLWAPHVALPPWWGELPSDRPVIYVALGSSGRRDLLATVLEALGDLPVTVMAATAGAPLPVALPPNARVAPYLPGDAAAARSALVVCSGGSAPAYQALAAGKPLLGLPFILDQHMSMHYLRSAGVAEQVRSDQATAPRIAAAVTRMLSESRYAHAAGAMAQTFARYDAASRFMEVIQRLAGASARIP